MKMKIKRPFLLFILLLLNFLKSYAQSSEETIHNRYWTYREFFRKHFTSIGDEPGQGLVFSEIDARGGTWGADMNITPDPLWHPETHNVQGKLIIGGDVTAFMAEYMGVLSSEYWLLKNTGKDGSEEMKAVLNELYFAINAVERLDKYAAKFFDKNQPVDANTDGFFVRDDSPTGIANKFDFYAYPEVHWMEGTRARGRILDLSPGLTDYPTMRYVTQLPGNGTTYQILLTADTILNPDGLYFDENTVGQTTIVNSEPSRLNEMSMDQLIGIFFGFKCIMKFVDDRIEVDPDGTGTLPKKNLKKWVQDLTDKMMMHLSAQHSTIPVFDDELQDDRWKKKCKKDKCGSKDVKDKDCPDCAGNKYRRDIRKKPNNALLGLNATYYLTTPYNEGHGVYRGSFAFGFGYPLEKLGEDITGKDYSPVRLKLSAGFQVTRYALDATSLFLEYEIAPIFGTSEWILGVWSFPAASSISPDQISLTHLGRPFTPHYPSWWRDAYNYLPRSAQTRNALRKSTAAGMFIWLPPASGTWTHQEYFDLMKDYDRKEADLFWSVLNDERPMIASSEVESTLQSTNCEVVQNTESESDLKFNRYSYFSHISSNGSGEDGYNKNWVHSTGDRLNQHYYNGLDWMIMYNFYRIAQLKGGDWKVPPSDVVGDDFKQGQYKDDYCPCHSSIGFYKDRNLPFNSVWNGVRYADNEDFRVVHNFDEHITTLPYSYSSPRENIGTFNIFIPGYKDYGINLSDWLVNNITISSTGVLKPLGDLTVCGEHLVSPSPAVYAKTTVTVSSSGQLSTDVNTDAGHYKVIRFIKGANLVLENNGLLNVENNTMVIFEKGSFLKYEAGARVKLNGPNAILKFDEGYLMLGDNAEFKIEGGTDGRGYVHFNRNWSSDIKASIIAYNGYKTAKVNLEGSSTSIGVYYNDLILKITGNAGMATDWNIKNFSISKAFIAIDKGSVLVSNAESSNFWKCNVNTLSNSEIDKDKHNGIEIPGRINKFEEVQIYNGNYGINYYNRGGEEYLKLKNVTTKNCNTGISVVGGGFTIEDSYIEGHSQAINAIGSSVSSTLNNTTVQTHGDGVGPRFDAVHYQGSRTFIGTKSGISLGLGGFNIADAKASLRCNTVYDNNVNLLWVNSPAIDMKNGFNAFDQIREMHISGIGNTWFDFKNNYNKYISPYQHAAFNMIYSETSPWLWNTMTGPPNSWVIADNNCFYQGGGASIDLTTFPNNPNYYLQLVKDINSTGSPVTPNTPKIVFSDPSYHLNISSINTSISGGCTEINMHGPVMIKDYESHLPPHPVFIRREIIPAADILKPDINQSLVVVSNPFAPVVTKPLTTALMDNYIRIYEDSIPRFDSAIIELGNILTENAGNDSLSMSPKMEDMYFIYDMFNNAYADLAFYRDSADTVFVSMFDKVDSFFVRADSVFISLWDQSKDSNSMWYTRKYELGKDWAQIRRLANHKEGALSVLDTVISALTDSLEIKGLEKWKCINQFEIAMQADSTLSWDSAIAMFPCLLDMGWRYDSAIVKDTTIHYCNWQDKIKNYNSHAIFQADSNLESIQMLEPQKKSIRVQDSSLIYDFEAGKYRLIYFDTISFETTVVNLTVIGDTLEIEDHDTTIHYCDKNSFSIKSYYKYIPASVLPFCIIDSADWKNTDTMLLDHSIKKYTDTTILQPGNYLVEVYDTNNCKIIRTNLTVIADTVEIIEVTDTTIYHCLLDTFFNNYLSSFEYGTMPGVISNRYIDTSDSDSLLIGINIDFCDTVLCRAYRTRIDFHFSRPTIVTTDTTISYCFIKHPLEYGHIDFIPQKPLPFHIFQIAPDTSVVFDSVLYAGEYIVSYYDLSNCTIYRTNLTVTGNTPDTVEYYDTVYYPCDHRNENLPYPKPDCEVGILLDTLSNPLELQSGDHYDVNPQGKFYTYYCYDSANCQVTVRHISFADILEIPPIDDNYLEGSYNRAIEGEGNECCFVNLTGINCEGDSLELGQEIKIYTLDSVFLFTTTIASYNPYILGFRFCPPYWDTDPRHINDWYSIVFKKGICLVCRLDFMCDSNAFEDMQAPQQNAKQAKIAERRKANDKLRQANEPSDGTASTISVHPNPANTFVNVNIRNVGLSLLTINISDATGKDVFSKVYQPTQSKLDAVINLDSLSNGIYTVYIPELNYYYKLVLIK